MVGNKDRIGCCDKCKRYESLSFARDAELEQFQWLCARCERKSSSHTRAAQVSETNKQSTQLLRAAHEERRSQGKIRLSTPPPGGPVLVVEDDLGIRTSVCAILEDEGFATVSAGDGKEALELLRTLDPSPRMILLDLMMPGMNGWEFYERMSIDKTISSIPVVIMTAHEGDLRLGSLKLLRKPLHLEELLEAVTHASSA
jgi:CheY-like chemotaxis protein